MTQAHRKTESGVNIVADRKMLGIVGSDGIKAFSYPEYARLIAVAPELLEALEAAAHWINEEVERRGDEDEEYEEPAHKEVERIWALIAKAKGE